MKNNETEFESLQTLRNWLAIAIG